MVKDIALTVVGVLIAVLLGETALRLFVPVRVVGPAFSKYDPTYGTSLKKNMRGLRITPEYSVEMSTNSYGFRGAEPKHFPSRSVLFLGDSFTMGIGVSDGEEFSALIAEQFRKTARLSAVPVVNMGIGDNGNGRWVKFLRQEGAKYKPLLIVLQLHGNDFEDNIREGLFSLREGQLAENLHAPAKKLERYLQEIVEAFPALAYSYVVGLGRQVLFRFDQDRRTGGFVDDKARPFTSPDPDLLTYALLREILSLCDRNRWPVLALIVEIEDPRSRELGGILNSFGVPYVEFPSRAEAAHLYYGVDGHWNTSGHKIAAERIMTKILELNL